MLKKVLPILLLLPLLAFDSGEKYLGKITLYQHESYFKQKVYDEQNWKSFYQLKEAQVAIDPNNYDLHLISAAVFFATNKIRESKGLRSLKFTPELRDAAVLHTDQMIEKNFFDHYNNRSPLLRTPDQRIKLFRVRSNAIAENIDYNNMPLKGKTTYIQLAEKIMDELYHSPPHRKNMLGKEYSFLGCAAIFEARDKQGVRYIKTTQDFAADF